MKQLVLLLMILSSLTSFAQEKRKWRGNFLLSGQVQEQQSTEAVLTYTDITPRGSSIKEKRASISNGKFGFSDFIEEPVFAELSIGANKYALYLDPTVMQVVIKDGNNLAISGSWTNDDLNRIALLDERIAHLADGEANVESSLAEFSFASTAKDSFIVLNKMLEVSNPTHPLYSDNRSKQMIAILMNMSDDLKNTPTGVKVSEALFIASVNMFTK